MSAPHYDECPYCSNTGDAGGQWIYECTNEECGEVYCSECGDGLPKMCPACGSSGEQVCIIDEKPLFGD
jgi:hypothetical protein